VKHAWEDVKQGIEGISNYGKRRCSNCGAEQIKYDTQDWGRITGYRWEPLVGRCKGKPPVPEPKQSKRKSKRDG
jgi:hypothetical protein